MFAFFLQNLQRFTREVANVWMACAIFVAIFADVDEMLSDFHRCSRKYLKRLRFPESLPILLGKSKCSALKNEKNIMQGTCRTARSPWMHLVKRKAEGVERVSAPWFIRHWHKIDRILSVVKRPRGRVGAKMTTAYDRMLPTVGRMFASACQNDE